MFRLTLEGRVRAHLLALTTSLLVVFSGLLYFGVRQALRDGLDASLTARAAAIAGLVERDAGAWKIDGGTQLAAGIVGDLNAWTIAAFPDSTSLHASPAGPELDGLRASLADRSPPALSPATGPRPELLAAHHRDAIDGLQRVFVGVFAVRVEDEDERAASESPFDPSASARNHGDVGLDRNDEGDEGDEVIGHAPPGSPALITIAVAGDLSRIANTLGVLAGALLAVGLLTLLAAAGAAVLLSRRIVEPLTTMAATATAFDVTADPAPIAGSGTGDAIDRLADALNGAFDRVRRVYQRQTRFTADASHELRTPVSAIRTQVEVALRRERPAAEYRDTLEVVAKESVRMTELIEALLLLAQLDARKLETNIQPVALDRIARAAIDDLAPSAPDVTVSSTVEQPVSIDADPRLIEIAVGNLVSNAIRHGARPGTVAVRVSADATTATISVTDDGPGIPEDQSTRIFERFARADASRTRSTGGAGLGLSLVAAIAQLHGGTVEVTSEPGQGATFTLRLPRSG